MGVPAPTLSRELMDGISVESVRELLARRLGVRLRHRSAGLSNRGRGPALTVGAAPR